MNNIMFYGSSPHFGGSKISLDIVTELRKESNWDLNQNVIFDGSSPHFSGSKTSLEMLTELQK